MPVEIADDNVNVDADAARPQMPGNRVDVGLVCALRSTNEADRWWLRHLFHAETYEVARYSLRLDVAHATRDAGIFVMDLSWCIESLHIDAALVALPLFCFSNALFGAIKLWPTQSASLSSVGQFVSGLCAIALLLTVRFALSLMANLCCAVHQSLDRQHAFSDMSGAVEPAVADGSHGESNMSLSLFGFDLNVTTRSVQCEDFRLWRALALAAAMVGVHYFFIFSAIGAPLVHYAGLSALAAALVAHLLCYETLPALGGLTDLRDLSAAGTRLLVRAILCGVTARWLLAAESWAWFPLVALLPVLESAAHARFWHVDLYVSQ